MGTGRHLLPYTLRVAEHLFLRLHATEHHSTSHHSSAGTLLPGHRSAMCHDLLSLTSPNLVACLSTVAQYMSRRSKASQRHPSPFPWAAVSTTAGLPWEETGCGMVEFFWQQPSPAHIFLKSPGASVTGKEGSRSGQWPGDLSQQAQTLWQWDRHPALQLTHGQLSSGSNTAALQQRKIFCMQALQKGQWQGSY